MSKTGVHVVPELIVFHTPPEATPTKYFAGFFGSTAKPMTRPEVKAGPIERKRKPLKVGVDIGSRGVGEASGVGVALAVGLGLGDGDGDGCWARTHGYKNRIKNNARVHVDIVFESFL